jgi:hypothetical protein
VNLDVYWFRNPQSYLSSFGPGVLMAQSDDYSETGTVQCLVYVLFFYVELVFVVERSLFC